MVLPVVKAMMRISVPGNSDCSGGRCFPACRVALPWQSCRGFTLIELLVTMVIMGIVLGLAVVKLMPDEQSVLRDEANRLALLLENAGMEARASGRSMAWSTAGDGYQFWRKNDYGDWVVVEGNDEFRPRTLPQGMRVVSVQVESQLLQSGDRLVLDAASFALPFRIGLANGATSMAVSGNSSGAVTAVSGDVATGKDRLVADHAHS